MIMAVNLDVSKQIINAVAGILRIVHTVAQIHSVGVAAAIAILPAAHPFRNRRQSSALSVASGIWDSRIGSTVCFENGQRRASRVAAAVSAVVAVESTRDGSESSELAAVSGRACENIDKSTAVGVTGSVNSRGIDAVVVLDSVDEVGREDFVADAFVLVASTFPNTLIC